MMDDRANVEQASSFIAQPPSLSSRRFRPYPEYAEINDGRLPKLPKGWEVLRFKYVAHLMYGDSLPAEERNLGEVLVYGSNGSVGKHASANTLAPALVIGRKGSYGKLNYTFEPVFAIDTTYFMDARSSEMQLRWLYYVIQLLGLDSYSEDSAIPGLSREFVYSRTLPVPTVPEQCAIAEFLDWETGKIDALVEKKERLIELLHEKRTALITHAVTKGLAPDVPVRESGVEWLGEIPGHWEVVRIKHLSRFVTSGSRGWAGYYSEDGSLFLRIGNLNAGTVDLNLNEIQHVTPPFGSEGERTRVQPGDLLVSITALIGAVGVVPTKLPEAYVNQHIALVRLWSEHANSRWLAYCILSRIGQTQFLAELYGGTKDGLGLEDIRSLIVLLPPAGEQETIVEFLDREAEQSDILILKIREGIDRLKEFRTALISAAVTGKIDVREEVA
jgi:type I restriction enzyme, S subunit